MSLNDLKIEVIAEVENIPSADFNISVTRTQVVPHSGDGSITFPNLDDETQGCKLIETCVLYIDIRRSTELNFAHKPQTVSKLYSAFVRAMIRCARQYGGHVRGIIGDRVMVIFDVDNCFGNAVNTAILMNSVAKYVINKHFSYNTITCGIGIDFGRMLATKTGIRRHGAEQANYRNLVWLGHPANTASKLTDLANKDGEEVIMKKVYSAYDFGNGWVWYKERMADFLTNLVVEYVPFIIKHNNNYLKSFFLTDESITVKPSTPAILMTKSVYDGFKAAKPDDPTIVNNWFYPVDIKVPSYDGGVYGGNVKFTIFD